MIEKGPYAYDEYYNKFDIEWSDGGDVVTYNTQRFYVFNAERTAPGLSENDNLTLPYATVIGFQYLLSTIPINVTIATELYIEVSICIIILSYIVLSYLLISLFLCFPETVYQSRIYAYYQNITDVIVEVGVAIDASGLDRKTKASLKLALKVVQSNIDSLYQVKIFHRFTSVLFCYFLRYFCVFLFGLTENYGVRCDV